MPDESAPQTTEKEASTAVVDEPGTTPPGEIEVPIGDTKIKASPEKVGQAIAAGQNYERMLEDLISKGVIDRDGKPVTKPVTTEPKPEPKTDEDKLTALEKKQQDLEQSQKRDQVDRAFEKAQLSMEKVASNSPDCTNDSFKTVADTLVLAKYFMDPSINVAGTYKATVKDLGKFKADIIKEFTEKKVVSKESSGAGPGGIIAGLKPDEGFTKDDLSSGKVGAAFNSAMKKLREIS